MSGFVVLLAIAALGLLAALLLCKSREQRIATGVAFAVLILGCLCGRLLFASDAAGLPVIFAIACFALPPVAYAVVFVTADRRVNRAVGLGALRTRTHGNHERPSVSDSKKIRSARPSASSASAVVSVPASASVAVASAVRAKPQDLGFVPITPEPMEPNVGRDAGWDAWDNAVELKTTAQTSRAIESADDGVESESIDRTVEGAKPAERGSHYIESVTEPLFLRQLTKDSQPSLAPIVEPLTESEDEIETESRGGRETDQRIDSEFDSALEAESGAEDIELKSDAAIDSMAESEVFGVEPGSPDGAEPGEDEQEVDEPPVPSSIIPPLYSGDEDSESDPKLTPTLAEGFEFEPVSESEIDFGIEPEQEQALESELGPDQVPEPDQVPDQAPEPGQSSLDAEKFFSKAASLRDRGLFLVAAPIYAECALRCDDPEAARKASFEELACYVKGGKAELARDLALRLKASSEVLTPVESMKLDAVLGMEV